MLTFLNTECCFICSYITPIIYLLAGSQNLTLAGMGTETSN